MQVRPYVQVLVPALLAAAAPVAAQVAARPVDPAALPPADLAALRAEAVAAHPELGAAEARLEAARRRPAQSAALPDPLLSVAYQNDGVSSFTLGDTEFSWLALTWEQEVPRSAGRQHAAAAAEAGVAAASRDRDRIRLTVEAEVTAAYADLYRIDRSLQALDETRTTLAALAESARTRYEVGQGIQESVLKASTEVLRLDVERAALEAARRAAEAAINAATGRPAEAPIGPALAIPAGALPERGESLADAAVAASPAIALLEAQIAGAAAREEQARSDLKPGWSWMASYQYRGSLDPMVMGGIGIRLPVHRGSRQTLALEEAAADATAVRHDRAAAERRTRAEALLLESRVDRSERLIALYRDGLIPQAQGALESAQAAYAVGRLPILDLMGDLRTLFEARVSLATEEAARAAAIAGLEPLLARPLLVLAEGGPDAEVR